MACVMAKMSRKFSASILLLSVNLLLFTVASATYTPCPPPPSKKPYVPKYPPYVPKYPPRYVPKYPPAYPTCPTDALKLRVCANVLGLVNIVVGSQQSKPCCSLIHGLADLEAAVCLCTAIKANILGINLNVPVSLSLILNNCGKTLPHGFICP